MERLGVGGAYCVVLAVCLTLLHSCQVVRPLHHWTILTNKALCEEFLNWIMSHSKCMRTVQRAVNRNCTNFPGVEKGDAKPVSFNSDDVWALLVLLHHYAVIL